MSPKGIEKLVWVLIYGGLLLASLGAFVQREHNPIGWTMIVCGGIAAATGVVLIWVRSRLPR
jgi:hypothetical protein